MANKKKGHKAKEQKAKTTPPEKGEKKVDTTPEQPEPKYSEAYLRLYAEFDNYKKHQVKWQKTYIEQAQKRIVLPMIAILQDLGRFQNPPTPLTLEKLKEGVQVIHNKLWKTLTHEGVDKIATAQGTALNPARHLVLATQKLEKEGQEETIAHVVQEGYTLHQKAIVPAQVIAYKKDE